MAHAAKRKKEEFEIFPETHHFGPVRQMFVLLMDKAHLDLELTDLVLVLLTL